MNIRDPKVSIHNGRLYEINGIDDPRDRYPSSVTEVIKSVVGGVDYAGIPAHVLQKAADRGNEVHRLVALAMQDDPDFDIPATENEEAAKIAFRVVETLVNCGVEVFDAEIPLWSREFSIAGTADLWIKIAGEWAVADLKVTRDINLEYVRLQTAGYAVLIDDTLKRMLTTSSFQFPRRYVIHAPVTGGCKIKRLQERVDIANFCAIARVHRWRLLHDRS